MRRFIHCLVEIALLAAFLLLIFAKPTPVPRVPEREVNKWGAIEL